jgi:hypothetical protein
MLNFTTTSSTTQPRNQSPPTAIAIAKLVNGKASPSFNPASDVNANRIEFSSMSSQSPGPGSCTSDARTGSVGANTAPSSTAAASGSPRPTRAITAIAATVNGMVIPSSLHVVIQLRQPTAPQLETGARERHDDDQLGETLGDVVVGAGTRPVQSQRQREQHGAERDRDDRHRHRQSVQRAGQNRRGEDSATEHGEDDEILHTGARPYPTTIEVNRRTVTRRSRTPLSGSTMMSSGATPIRRHRRPGRTASRHPSTPRSPARARHAMPSSARRARRRTVGPLARLGALR